MFSKNNYKLFLDDLRMPADCVRYMRENEIYKDEDWVIVRNFDEFCETITNRWSLNDSAPILISFDHDLGIEHTRYYFENGGHENPPNPDDATFVTKSGKDCANWLIRYCQNQKMPFPDYVVHSKNPIGAENIRSVLDQYKKHIQDV